MPLTASIMNLGAPLNATPEVMAALRAEKSRQARITEDRDRARLLELADYISTHPESLSQAKRYVERFLNSPAHSALHWALREWDEILAERSLSEIADLLRDNSESTRHLRETSPFSRPQSADVIALEIRDAVSNHKARIHAEDLRVADYIEANPERSIDEAKEFVARFLDSARHVKYRWILQRWDHLLQTKTPSEIAQIFRESKNETEELRSSAPFCGEALLAS